MIVIHDAATGETVEREETEAELAQREADTVLALLQQHEAVEAAAVKAAARIALLDRLGISEEEAALLGGAL
jgi:hypothetical protein